MSHTRSEGLGLHRRSMLQATLAGAGLVGAGLTTSGPALAATRSRAPDLREIARLGWLYTIPLVEVARARAASLVHGAAINSFGHVDRLIRPGDRDITTPNNDTLYSSAQVDLSKGPVRIAIPDVGDRYFSLAFMDAWTNNFVVLGGLSTAGWSGEVILAGPDHPGDAPNQIRSPTTHAWVLGRMLVDGPDDLPAATDLQKRLVMTGPPVPTPETFADRRAPWPEYFASASRLMAINRPPVSDFGMLETLRPLGLTDFDPRRFTAEEGLQIAAGVEDAKALVRTLTLGNGAPEQGWTYPAEDIGDFGIDYELRAGVAFLALAALPRSEAMYMRSVGELDGNLHDGARDWVLHFPPGQTPAAHGFWSLTLYEATPEGQFFFYDNPAARYAIGDRTPGLRANADGSLDIWISNRAPGDDRMSNWLPAPKGPFTLFMRTYLPKTELLDGRYRLPALVAEPGR